MLHGRNPTERPHSSHPRSAVRQGHRPLPWSRANTSVDDHNADGPENRHDGCEQHLTPVPSFDVRGPLLGTDIEVLEGWKPSEHEDQHPHGVQGDGSGCDSKWQLSVTADVRHPPPDRRAECRYVESQLHGCQADDPTPEFLPLPGEHRRPDQQDRDSPTHEDCVEAVLCNRFGRAGSVSDADVAQLFSWSRHRPESTIDRRRWPGPKVRTQCLERTQNGAIGGSPRRWSEPTCTSPATSSPRSGEADGRRAELRFDRAIGRWAGP